MERGNVPAGEEVVQAKIEPAPEGSEGTARDKAFKALTLCKDSLNLSDLIALATSEHGLVNDEVRRKVCMFMVFAEMEKKISWLRKRTGPIILGFKGEDSDIPRSWRSLPRHKDEDQVQLDVNRSFIYYPQSTQLCLLHQYPKSHACGKRRNVNTPPIR